MMENLYSILEHPAKCKGNSTTSLDDSSGNSVGLAGCDAVPPVVACLAGHQQYVARFEKDVSRSIRLNVPHGHDAWRAEAEGEDGVIEAGAAVDMRGNSLAWSVFIDDQLIVRSVRQSFVAEFVDQIQGPHGKWSDSGGRVKSFAAVVVSVSILLHSALQIVQPWRAVDRFQQRGLSRGSDSLSKVLKSWDGHFLRGEFEKHDVSISLG